MDQTLLRLARSNNTILITGRTGTGKSHLAHKIHQKSKRADKRFVAINLATLSENLIESELFGHERGAFSGADQKRIGKLECANEGTVFLDEIGELSMRLQTKLLDALNNKVISPVGSNREIQLNIRIITATNRNLLKMVENREFREDLYYRINTFQVELPDLREQTPILAKLTHDLASKAALEQGTAYESCTQEYLNAITSYNWPGNIRELKNTVEFSLALSSNGILEYENLPPYIRKCLQSNYMKNEDPTTAKLFSSFPNSYYESKATFEKLYLEEMLRRFDGKINLTARNTSLSKVTLIEKIRRYEIDVNRIKFSKYQDFSINSTRKPLPITG